MEHTVHFIAEILAITIGVQLYFRSKVIDSVSEQARIYLIIGALLGALFGSRFFAALEDPSLFINPPSILYYYANKTIIGGIAGGIIGIEIAKKFLKISAWTGDRALVPLAVAIIIGRIGCFVAGVQDGTVGGPCDYFWCLEQGDEILRHPNSLYEITFISLFLVAYHQVKTLRPGFLLPILDTPGAAFRAFIVGYFTLRFGIEFLKDTHPLLLDINSIQIVCILFVLWYTKDLIKVYRKARQIG